MRRSMDRRSFLKSSFAANCDGVFIFAPRRYPMLYFTRFRRASFLKTATSICLVLFLGACEKAPKEMPVITGMAEVNGTRLYYEVAGSGDPIVLIHGNFGDCRHWDDQFEVFAKSHKVIRYDVRGYGKSALPVQGESYGDHDDLKALLGYLGISKAHIAGLSMGCGIAVDFVLAYPEMSNSLIAVGPWVSGFDSPAVEDVFNLIEKTSSIAKESGPRAAAEYFINDPCFNPQMISSRVKNRITEIAYDYTFWHFINEDPRRSLDPPAVQQLDRISLPTLIITAEYDIEACKEIANLLEKTIPNARKIDIADATHVMLMEKPAEFNKIVLDFLANI